MACLVFHGQKLGRVRLKLETGQGPDSAVIGGRLFHSTAPRIERIIGIVVPTAFPFLVRRQYPHLS